MTNLISKNIFIDTQAFMQEGFKFDNPILTRILELSRKGKINLIITVVVKREVENKIKEKVETLIKSKKELQRNLTILEDLAPKELLSALEQTTENELLSLGKAKWDNYLKKSKAIILEPNKICVDELLSHYFDGSYPFSSGKKKNEFPDAISLLSIHEWLSKNNESIYVISKDSDLKGYCSTHNNFISYDHISKFLDLYSRVEERLTTVIHKLLEREDETWLKTQLIESFMNCGFDYADNWDAEVENVIVNSLDIIDKDVIDVESEKSVVSFRVDINFNADISGPDYANAMWDGEEKEYFFLEDFNINVEVNETYDVTVDFAFRHTDEYFTGIEFIQFENSDHITIYNGSEY